MQWESSLSGFAEAQPFFETKSQRMHERQRTIHLSILRFGFTLVLEPLGT